MNQVHICILFYIIWYYLDNNAEFPEISAGGWNPFQLQSVREYASDLFTIKRVYTIL